MSNQCLAYPLVNGDPSELYKGIYRAVRNKALANYIYAAYLQSGVAAKMDARGNKRNKQDEHTAKDVLEFFNVSSMQNEVTHKDRAELQSGAKDSSGNNINYTDANEALNKAKTFNETSKAFVASVIQIGDHFNIIIQNKDARTQIRASEVREQQLVWDVIKQAFNIAGVDIEALSNDDTLRETVNPIKGVDFVKHLNNIKLTRNSNIAQRDLVLLLKINESSSQVQRLKAKWGEIEDVANVIYNNYRTRGGTVTASEASLIESTLNQCKKLNGLDLNALENQVKLESNTFKSGSEEEKIKVTLEVLDKKFNIGAEEIHIIGNKIRSLSDAAANAAITIKRQIDKLVNEKGVTSEAKSLEATLSTLVQELKSKHHYAGCLNFLHEASNQIIKVIDAFNNLPTSGTKMEMARENSKVLLEIQAIRNAYYDIVSVLSNIDSIVIEENISDVDKKILKDLATDIKNKLDAIENRIQDKRISTMTDIATEYLGESLDNGVAVSSIVMMAEADSSIFDNFYSIARVSDPLIATMGGIIRDAQDNRDQKLNAVRLQIRRANRKLTEAGHTSEFMYGEDGYIISDIDWTSYKEAKRKARIQYQQSGKRGLDLDAAMQSWEEANTEDRIVDFKSGRTEKVPNNAYRKPFPTLTAAQQEYYNTMMQLKGEMGTLLPHYAQKQYLPPQLRRSFLDALGNAKSIMDVVRAFWNKMKDPFVRREDDTDFVRNAVVDGEEYGVAKGNLNNNPIRMIPIFYVKRIKDQKELMKDFSGAMTALSGTAINYDAMNQIREIVEFMGDFIKERKISATSNNKGLVEAVIDKGIRIYKSLFKVAEGSRTASIVDSAIAQHLYGIKLKDQGSWVPLLKSLLQYTSIRNLAVNLKGMISNALVGEAQMLIEAGAGEFYNIGDYIWAKKTLFGDLTIKGPSKMIDFLTNNRNSYDVLLADIFDPIPGGFEKNSHQRYYNSLFRKLASVDLTFIGYQAGEYALHMTGMYAVLHNTKVLIDGKKSNLYEAFVKTNKEDGNVELVLKNDVTDLDGNPIDQEFIDNIRKRIRYANQTTQGAMNDEDKGIIQQRMWGRFIMNFRQWMVEYYSKRYRGEYWDASTKQKREGYWSTMNKLMKGYANDFLSFKFKTILHSSEMNEMQKANIRRLVVEHALLGSLHLLSMALGEPEDHKKEFWYRMWIYQTKRLIMDLSTSNPIGATLNFRTMLNSPIAATNTVNSLLYPIFGIGDITETIQRGPYAGWNKYGRNVLKYTTPFYDYIDQIYRMDEDDAAFKIFDSSFSY